LENFETTVIRPAFDECRPVELKDDPECRSYYIFSVANIMKVIALWANANNYFDTIHYIFACNADEAGNLARWFAYLMKHPGKAAFYRLGKGYSNMPYDTQFAAKEPALQMADCAAYEFNKAVIKWIKNDCKDTLKSEFRRSLTSLARADHRGWLFRKKELLDTWPDIIQERIRFPV
jgi:hypothetical protein